MRDRVRLTPPHQRRNFILRNWECGKARFLNFLPELGTQFLNAWCLMHAWWFMAHGSRRMAHGHGRPGEAHGSWPVAGPAPGHGPWASPGLPWSWAMSLEPWAMNHQACIKDIENRRDRENWCFWSFVWPDVATEKGNECKIFFPSIPPTRIP